MNMKKKSNDWAKPSVIVAIASVALSIIAALSAWNSAKEARVSSAQASAAGTHIELMKDFDEVAQAIPMAYRDGDPPPPARGSNAWRAMTRYWYLAYKGWLTTKRFGNETLVALWDQRYQDLIATQLNKQAHRAVLCYLIREKFSQTSLQAEFGGMYSDLYKARSGKDLCPAQSAGKRV